MEFTTTTLEGAHVTVMFNTDPDGIEVTSVTDEFDNNLVWEIDGFGRAYIYNQCRKFLDKEREEADETKFENQSFELENR